MTAMSRMSMVETVGGRVVTGDDEILARQCRVVVNAGQVADDADEGDGADHSHLELAAWQGEVLGGQQSKRYPRQDRRHEYVDDRQRVIDTAKDAAGIRR